VRRMRKAASVRQPAHPGAAGGRGARAAAAGRGPLVRAARLWGTIRPARRLRYARRLGSGQEKLIVIVPESPERFLVEFLPAFIAEIGGPSRPGAAGGPSALGRTSEAGPRS